MHEIGRYLTNEEFKETFADYSSEYFDYSMVVSGNTHKIIATVIKPFWEVQLGEKVWLNQDAQKGFTEGSKLLNLLKSWYFAN